MLSSASVKKIDRPCHFYSRLREVGQGMCKIYTRVSFESERREREDSRKYTQGKEHRKSLVTSYTPPKGQISVFPVKIPKRYA